ncbi:MAG: DMT family transporter [Pseudomonadota bacterium]|nr:DMT family transporter [Pseudomonadota bacterium]
MNLSPSLQGILWMLTSTASFSAMIIAVRFLSDTIPPFEQVFLRSVIGLAITLPTMVRVSSQVITTFKPNRLGRLYALRGLCTFTGVSAWFYAIAILPLAEAVSLHFTLPVFGLILSAVILREQVTKHRWMVVAIGLIGVLIILRPGIAVFNYVAFAVFLSALGYAGGDICTKLLAHTETSRMIVFNLNLWLVFLAAVPTALEWQTPALPDVPVILIMGVTGWAAHMCLAQAMKCADVSVIIPVEFVRLPITACAAYIFFAEVPGVWEMIGAGIIFYGTWRLAVKEGVH